MTDERVNYQNKLRELDTDDFLFEYDNRLHFPIEKIYDCEVEMNRRLNIIDKVKKLSKELKSQTIGFNYDEGNYINGKIDILEYLLED